MPAPSKTDYSSIIMSFTDNVYSCLGLSFWDFPLIQQRIYVFDRSRPVYFPQGFLYRIVISSS